MHSSSTTDQHDGPHPGLRALMLRELRGKSAADYFGAVGGRMATIALRHAVLWSEDDDLHDADLAVAWARVWAQHVSTALPFPGSPKEIAGALSCALNERASRIWARAVTTMARAEWSALRDDAAAA